VKIRSVKKWKERIGEEDRRGCFISTIRTSIMVQDNMSRAFRSMTTALNVTLSSFEALQRASSNAIDTSSIETARRELASAELEINSIEQSLRDSQNQQDRFNRSVQSGNNSMGNLVNKARSLAGAYLGIQAIGQGIEAVDTNTSQQARLSLIVEPVGLENGATEQDVLNAKMQQTVALQEQIYQAVQRSRGAYSGMVDITAKLGLLAGDAFSGNDELVAFTELMQKSFKISGASTIEASNAMYQLTQAMASGRLQGDEYRSIIENAPMLADAIADYVGVSKGELKQLSSDGAISADIIKAAVFNMADDVETQFAQMPITFSDAWTTIKNTTTMQAQGLMQNVNNALNSSGGQAIINSITGAIGGLIAVLGIVFGLVADVSSFFSDNWSMIAPIVTGVVIALGLYTAALMAHNGVLAVTNMLEAISNIRKAVSQAATMMQAGATFTATTAQYGFNAALLACPITWIILLIIALIAAIYAVVASINHFAGTSISATGVIAGAFATLLAHIYNRFIVPLWNGFAMIANFIGNVFNDPVAAVKVLFYDMCLTVIGYIANMASAIENIINKIPGVTVDITSGLDNFKSKLESTSAKVKSGSEWKEVVSSIDYKDYGNAYKAGYNFGQGIDEKVGNMFDFNSNDIKSSLPDYQSLQDSIGGIGEGIGSTADNTGRTADALETTEEDLKYLRDLAETEVIDRTVFRDIKVELGGVTNNVNSNMDLDGIVDYIGIALEDAMLSSAEGVH